MWVWWKKLILSNFNHFWPFLGYLGGHLYQIWPNNTGALFVRSHSIILATFYIFFCNFFSFFKSPPILTFLAHFWPPLNHCNTPNSSPLVQIFPRDSHTPNGTIIGALNYFFLCFSKIRLNFLLGLHFGAFEALEGPWVSCGGYLEAPPRWQGSFIAPTCVLLFGYINRVNILSMKHLMAKFSIFLFFTKMGVWSKTKTWDLFKKGSVEYFQW